MMYQMHQIYQTPGFYEPSHQTHQMQAFYGANYQMQPYLSTGFTSLHNPGISYYSDHITTGPHSSTYYIVPQHGAYMNMMASDPVGQYPQAVSNYRLQPPAGQPQLQRQASERPGTVILVRTACITRSNLTSFLAWASTRSSARSRSRRPGMPKQSGT